MSIVESLKTYIETCPHLEELTREIGVGNLPEDPTAYSIDPVPASNTEKRFLGGYCKRSFNFLLAVRFDYGDDVKNQIDNVDFFHKFTRWLEKEGRDGNLPDLGEDAEAQSLKAITNGYVYDAEGSTARYQVECKFVYIEA